MQYLVTPQSVALLIIAAAQLGCGKVERGSVDAPSSDASQDAADAAVDAPVPHTLALAAGGATAVLGTAGDPFTDHCAEGQALVGFHGATGSYGASVPVVGQIVGHCSTLRIGAAGPSGFPVTADSGVLLTPRGADTATHWTTLCPDNQFVVGLAVRAGSALDQLALQCAPLILIRQGNAWGGQIGAVTLSNAVGGSGGVAMNGLCPDSQVATVSAPKVLAQTAPALSVVSAIGVQCSVVHAE